MSCASFIKYASLPARIKFILSLRPEKYTFDQERRAAVQAYLRQQALGEPAVSSKKERHLLAANVQCLHSKNKGQARQEPAPYF